MHTVRLNLREVTDGRLPMICMRCGAPAASRERHTFRTGAGGRFLFLPGRLVFWLGEPTSAQIPLCARHTNLFRQPVWVVVGVNVLMIVTFVLAVAMLLSGLAARFPLLFFAGAVTPVFAMFVGVVWLLVLRAGLIRCLEVTRNTITLTNVSGEFLDQCAARLPSEPSEERQPAGRARSEFSESTRDSASDFPTIVHPPPSRASGVGTFLLGGVTALLVVGVVVILGCCVLPMAFFGWMAWPTIAPSPNAPGPPQAEVNPPEEVKPRPIDPNLDEKALTTVYLSDMQEFDARVGYGRFGKDGMLGYGVPFGGPEPPITVGGKKSPKGISMAPPASGYSTVKYRLGKTAKLFKGSVAVHDLEDGSRGPRSPLTFKVYGDGDLLWISDPLQTVATTLPCRVSVVDVDILELRVYCPGELYNARAVWLEPHVLK